MLAMMRTNPLTLLGILTLSTLTRSNAQPKSDFHHSKEVKSIAFGSCFNPRKNEHTIFAGVLKHRPDVFILLGDNIYGDTHDMPLLKTKYAELEAVEPFRKLRDASTLLATWDDHDYGTNDGGKSYTMRSASEEVFLDFFKDPSDSPRRQREGVYGSYTFGSGDRVCQVLLLDTRYFRDELPRSKDQQKEGTVGWYKPTADIDKTLLGEAQWKWLDQQLQVPAKVRIIASSIQTLAFEKGMENWGNVPHEQQRLFKLLKKHRAHHTFAISGDVHFAELSKIDLEGYPFYDLTSSGMSHTSKSWASAKNSYRVGNSHWNLNAGLIKIDWTQQVIHLAIINSMGEQVLHHPVKLSELTFNEPDTQNE